MTKTVINFTFLLTMILLIERLSYSVPDVFVFWFGLITGTWLYSAYDLFFNEIKQYYD